MNEGLCNVCCTNNPAGWNNPQCYAFECYTCVDEPQANVPIDGGLVWLGLAGLIFAYLKLK